MKRAIKKLRQELIDGMVEFMEDDEDAGWPRLSRFGLYRGGGADRGLRNEGFTAASLLC